MTCPLVVFGSVNMDLVVYSQNEPKAGETIHGSSFALFQGGKGANQAVAASRLGARVAFAGAVGKDYFGDSLVESLKREKIDLSLMNKESAKQSGTAFIFVYEKTAENQIIVVAGANSDVSASQISEKALASCEILISQLEISQSEVATLFERAKKHGCLRILNPAPAASVSKRLIEEADLLVVNETELATLSGEPVLENCTPDTLTRALKKINLRPTQSAVVTLGEKGAFSFDKAGTMLHPSRKVLAVDTTGSGDCFVGALGSQLLQSHNLQDACEFANKAASLSVTAHGASNAMPYINDVIAI